MSHIEVNALAADLLSAYSNGGRLVVPPSLRDPDFDLATAYAVEAQLTKLRRETGRTTVGRKVGYASKALWRRLKLDTLVWAHMYDDTVTYAENGSASLSLAGMRSPRIEPEIVFKLNKAIPGETPGAALEAVEWLALGFEIVDCVFPDWKFQPADFVASFGLHAALIVGKPVRIEPDTLPTLAEQLPTFKARLLMNGDLIDEGTGKNSLGSPALSLGELAAAIGRQPGAEPLVAGELISTGSLTAAQPVAGGQQWRFEVEGLSCCIADHASAVSTVFIAR